jgi:hypothetical protein
MLFLKNHRITNGMIKEYSL